MRVDHVGSLLRPERLKTAFLSFGAGRIYEAARFILLEQLALGPQCGFASGIGGNLPTEDEQRAKLDVVLETARRVWK